MGPIFHYHGDKAAEDSRYVVTKRHAGLGDLLMSLSGAWWYAKHTGRQVLIDWRNAPYNTDPQRNLLPEVLQTPQELGGVRLHGDFSKLSALRRRDFYPKRMSLRSLKKPIPETARRSRDQVALVKQLRDQREKVIVFSECLSNLVSDAGQEYRFFNSLTFHPACFQAAEEFAAEEFADKLVIGIHLRHGNGGNIMGHAPYWANPVQSLAKCCEVLKRCISLCNGKPHVVYLATDSPIVEQTLQASFPRTIVFPKQHRKPGEGELHRGNTDPMAVRQAVTEMLILAKSQILVRFPPASYFSHYPSIVKPRSGLYCEKLATSSRADFGPEVVF